MGRPKPFGKRKKVFCVRASPKVEVPRSEPATPALPMPSSEDCSSKNKLSPGLSRYNEFSGDEEHDIINISAFGDKLKDIACCNICYGTLHVSVVKRNGLACEISVVCMDCEANCMYSNSHNIVGEGVGGETKTVDEMNCRFVYAMRSLGKGHGSSLQFCALMNLPPPPTKFGKFEKVLGSSIEKCAKLSMKNAVEEAVSAVGDGTRNIGISLDGSWQKRGHSSLNGIMSAISVDTGKVVDIEILSKHCRCQNRLKGQHGSKCAANYNGTSGGMEVVGAKNIFSRSIELYDARYSSYLGDGDCKGFQEVVQSNPYGDECPVEKLECIGHVQKRIGTRLRKFKDQVKKTKGQKAVGGKGRLTNAAITKIQNYYGVAIRQNNESVQKMKQAIWAIYFHLISSDENPSHGLCASWCKYKQAMQKGEKYVHKKHMHLPKDVMEMIKPIFKDLSNPVLLQKCLHGKTQNPNESLNNCIWHILPKNTFVMLQKLKMGSYEAVGLFNEGNIIRCDVLQSIGIAPGKFCKQILNHIDRERIRKAERAVAEVSKKARQRISVARKKLEDVFEAGEGEQPAYSAGGY